MYKLSRRSKERLVGVRQELVEVVELAIQLTEVDFTVGEGVRSLDRQRELVKQGASKTLNSRHLTGHAVDLIALVDGKPSWEWPPYEKLALAMQQAAAELKVTLVWGGVWDKPLDKCGAPAEECKRYSTERKKAGRSVLLDGPHFELDRSRYP